METLSKNITQTSFSLSYKQILTNFILGSMVCMSNGLHDSRLCYTVFIKTCNFLGLKKKTFQEFSAILTKVEDEYKTTKVYTYAEYLLMKMRKIQKILEFFFPLMRAYIEGGIKEVEIKIANDGNVASWPITDAYYIWPWLHVISIDMDLNYGLEEKKAFLKFIPDIIACNNCRSHYLRHLDELFKSLMKTTCANTLLALHTFINSHIIHDDREFIKFIYDKNLVNLFFHKKYQTEYLILKTNHE